MRRRLFLTLAVLAGLLVAAVSVVIALRTTIAEAVLISRLAAIGVASPRLTVESLDLGGIVVSDIALGAREELRADVVTVAYRGSALLSGQVDDVAIDGLRLRLDLSGAGPPLGSLQHLLAGGEGAAGPVVIPDVINLTGSRIDLLTASGDAAASVSGHWRPAGGTAALTIDDFAVPQVALETSRLDIAMWPDRIDATARVRGGDGSLFLELNATVESWRGDPTLTLDLDGDLTPAAWRVPPLPLIEQGRMGLSLHAGGPLQPFRQLSADRRGLAWLLAADLGGSLGLSFADIAGRDGVTGLSGSLDLAVNVSNGGAEAIVKEGRVTVDRIDPDLLQRTGLEAVVPGLRDNAITVAIPPEPGSFLRLRATDEGALLTGSGNAAVDMADSAMTIRAGGDLRFDREFDLRRVSLSQATLGLGNVTLAGGHRLRRLQATGAIAGPPDDLVGTAELGAELAATRFADLALGPSSLDLAADIHWTGQRLKVRQRGVGTASVASLASGSEIRIAKPLALGLADGEATLVDAPGGSVFAHAISVRADPVTVDLLRPDGPPVGLRVDPGTIRLEGTLQPDSPYRGRLALSAGRIAVPGHDLVAEAITAAVSLPAVATGRFAEFAVAQLVHRASPPYFVPMRINGTVARQDDIYRLTAVVSGVDGGLRLAVSGRHRIADGRGALRLELPEIAFRKDARQPLHLFPLLGDIRKAEGRIGADAEFTWSPGNLRSKGKLYLADMSFVIANTTVSGLATAIALDGLLPPATPPNQSITVRRIDPALPLDDVAARFRLEPGWPPRLHLAAAGARFAGGRLEIAPTIVDWSDPRHEFAIAVADVDLGTLVRLVKAEDVSATGTLSGLIPVTVADGTATVRDGRLAAGGPGVLRIKSEAARSALGGAGENVALMLSALEDFRYDSLSAALNIGTGGDMAVMVRMRGHNPAVLDGYPFAFNIGLDGNLAKLLAALRQGARLSTDLVRPQLR